MSDLVDKDFPEQFRNCLNELARQRKFLKLTRRQVISGHSGAQTYIVTANNTEPMILKCGHAKEIKEDLEGHDKAQGHFHDAVQVIGGPVSVDSVSCFLMEFKGGVESKTYEEFYNSAGVETIAPVTEKLFNKVLRPQELDNRSEESVFSLHQFDQPHMQAVKLHAIGDPWPTLVDWWDRASRIYKEKLMRSREGQCHGDLHARNVIVSPDNNPIPIDFARVGIYHSLRDFTKFEREIRLSLYPKDELLELLDFPTNTADTDDGKAYVVIRTLREKAKAVPFKADRFDFEYLAALAAQFIFAAGNPEVGNSKRQLALRYATQIRKWLEKQDPELTLPDEEARHEKRKDLLWRFAYSFYRLDQLPSGGWGKTLYRWMDALWEGDNGEIPRDAALRTRGGTDLTGHALRTYLRFRDRQICQAPQWEGPGLAAVDNLENRIGHEGGIDVIVTWGRIPLRIRHTLTGVLSFLTYSLSTDLPRFDALRATTSYLRKYLTQSDKDQSHPFAMYATATKLSELIELQREKIEQDNLIPELDDFIACLTGFIEHTGRNVIAEGAYEAKPPHPKAGNTAAPFFKPYYGFWRMERSNFLMYFPLLVSEDGEGLLINSPGTLSRRCAHCFATLLEEVQHPFLPDKPWESLVCYHRVHASLDWGLSASLAANLTLPAVRKLLLESNLIVETEFDAKCKALNKALIETFDGYYGAVSDLFKFTHGVDFGQYLETLFVESLDCQEIEELDHKLDTLRRDGVTEEGISGLLAWMMDKAGASDQDVYLNSLKDLLVDKLESGEHTPDKDQHYNLCNSNEWNNRIGDIVQQGTIDFYDGPGGKQYCKRYGDDPITTFVTRLKDVVWGNPAHNEKPRALDVGCGCGQYAELLAREGYQVDLLDASEHMLELASQRLGVKKKSSAFDLYNLPGGPYQAEHYDLVFACAMMVHVPPDKAAKVYQGFYQLLKPGGLLFVNLKLRDHTLISKDGRYYAYYKDYDTPAQMLKGAGFDLEEINLRWNNKNLYGDPKEIRWVNFYCRKPTEGDAPG